MEPYVNYPRQKMLATQSSTANIPNQGITRLTALSTYTLDAPVKGALKTIYRSASMSTAASVVNAGSGRSFNSAGGTQVLLLQPTTVGGGMDIGVTLIGESSVQWRIMSAFPGVAADSTGSGIRVTT